jgi:Lhr-like helicase
VFGHTVYKGKQKEIVEAAFAGSLHSYYRVFVVDLISNLGADVLVVAPTGMGKVR